MYVGKLPIGLGLKQFLIHHFITKLQETSPAWHIAEFLKSSHCKNNNKKKNSDPWDFRCHIKKKGGEEELSQRNTVLSLFHSIFHERCLKININRSK